MAGTPILTPAPAAPGKASAPVGPGRTYRCPLCQHVFPEAEMGCHHGCPVSRRCQVVCCPNCGYEFVDPADVQARFRRWAKAIRRLWRGGA